MAGFRKGLLSLGENCSLASPRSSICCFVLAAGSSVAFSPGNLSTSSSASSTLGSPENEEYILSFETIDKMRRVSSYSSLNSLIGELSPSCPSLGPPLACVEGWDPGSCLVLPQQHFSRCCVWLGHSSGGMGVGAVGSGSKPCYNPVRNSGTKMWGATTALL